MKAKQAAPYVQDMINFIILSMRFNADINCMKVDGHVRRDLHKIIPRDLIIGRGALYALSRHLRFSSRHENFDDAVRCASVTVAHFSADATLAGGGECTSKRHPICTALKVLCLPSDLLSPRRSTLQKKKREKQNYLKLRKVRLRVK
ncbi:hypothetical protein PUN28_014988 [Cardiocondyla obscurior]|uniref:Uncharacterized protein n=1 Tax=Cardiocondyla obscurior TaxID=286306 RepID=A0AAW2EZU1_9HYME